VVAGLPVCVTGDVDAARAMGARAFGFYNDLPSYRAMLDREGAEGPLDLAIIGDEESVAGRIRGFADLGVTDLSLPVFGSAADRTRTLEPDRARGALMRAATVVDGAIEVRQHPDPVPGTGQILVRIHGAGINGADILQKWGLYPPPPGIPEDIPGLELAGEVVGTGPGATRFDIGQPVMAVVGGAGQAELAVLHEREAMPVPAGLPWAEAGAIPEVFTTAHDALFSQAGLSMGERLCVHGAAGGVGTAGIQLALAAGARVVATVRSEAVRAAVAELGAMVIDPQDTEAHGPYDVILELVGAPNLAANLSSLATGGRIAVIGVGGGSSAEIDLRALMGKRAAVFGSTLRARPLEQKADAARRMEAHVLPLFESGRVRVPVHATFPLEQAAQAYDHFEAGSKFGKVVLTMP
jgi:putative PIG3 family NAD(P)H quinone oxidoreductase